MHLFKKCTKNVILLQGICSVDNRIEMKKIEIEMKKASDKHAHVAPMLLTVIS